MSPLKYSSSSRRTLEIILLNCEIYLISILSDKRVLSNDGKATTFAITDTKVYVPDVLCQLKVMQSYFNH